jgi:hypothetical protein
MSRRHGWRRYSALALFFCLLLLPSAAAAQGGQAGVVGTVTDAQAAAIPGATVVLTSTATGAVRETVTGPTGGYQFMSLPPGFYTLRVELAGFRTFIAEKLQLTVDTTARFDVRMDIGAIAETVQVTAETPVVNTVGREPRQRHSGHTDPRTAARGPQRRRLVEPAARRRLRASHGGVSHRCPVGLRQRREGRPVERHARRHRRQRQPVPGRLHVGAARHARLRAGVPHDDEQLRRRPGAIERCAGVDGDEGRHEYLPGLGLLVSPQHGDVQRPVFPEAVPDRRGGRSGSAQVEQAHRRRLFRRPDQARPNVLLHQLRGAEGAERGASLPRHPVLVFPRRRVDLPLRGSGCVPRRDGAGAEQQPYGACRPLRDDSG